MGVTVSREVDWKHAALWYDKVVNTNTEDEEGNFDGTMNDPSYQLIARQAAMYWSGGNGLEKNPNKAGKWKPRGLLKYAFIMRCFP